MLSGSIGGTELKRARQVLILYEVGISYPSINFIDQGIQSAFHTSPYEIEYYREYMEIGLFPDPAEQQRFRDFYLRKYQNHKPDIIITVGPAPLDFMLETHRTAFPGIPIVYCLPTYVGGEGVPTLDSDFTGIENTSAPLETIKAALRLQPATRHIVVVGGTTEVDKQVQELVKDKLTGYEQNFDISYLTNLTMPDLVERLKRLPNNTIIFYTGLIQDAAGKKFIPGGNAIEMIVAAANAPIFSMFGTFLNHGEVGGKVSDIREQGRIAGDMALRILKGEKPQDVPRVKDVTAYMFDWRALKRWGLKESNLPPGSIVLNRQPTVWESYKWYIIAGFSLILLESLLIFGLLWQRQRRKKVEAELAFTYDGLRMAVEAGSAVGWDWDVKNDRNRWFGDLQTIFGMPSDTYSAQVGEFRRCVHPEDQELVWKAIDEARQNRKPYVAEFRVVRLDGAVHWIIATGKFYYDNGEAKRMLGMAVDITERKRVEEALAGMSRKLIEAQEQERTRIARDLHDDIAQRLALLATEIEQLQDNPSEIRSRVQELRKKTTEISNGVQALSHDLHSSQLEYLGAVAGMKGWCREFGERQRMEIDYRHDVQSTLPPEIGLCLFRVLQEALHNAAKHSGVKRIEVQLYEESGEIHLIVSDSGRGIDVEAVKKGKGLGLISMRERVRLINGTISIESKPMGGTTIHVRVPFSSQHEYQTAAG